MSVQGQEVDLVIIVSPFQLSIFCDFQAGWGFLGGLTSVPDLSTLGCRGPFSRVSGGSFPTPEQQGWIMSCVEWSRDVA